MKVKSHKKANLEKAEAMIRQAHLGGAKIISLPEMFNCPYTSSVFSAYAEEETGETVQSMSALARELEIYLVAGTIPEKYGDKI